MFNHTFLLKVCLYFVENFSKEDKPRYEVISNGKIEAVQIVNPVGFNGYQRETAIIFLDFLGLPKRL